MESVKGSLDMWPFHFKNWEKTDSMGEPSFPSDCGSDVLSREGKEEILV